MRTKIVVLCSLFLLCGVALAQPVATMPPGVTISMQVQASGEDLNFEWRKDGVPLVDEGRVSGVTSDTLRVTMIRADDNGVYSIHVSNEMGATSDSVQLRVLAPPEIIMPITVEIVNPIAGVAGHNVYLAFAPSEDFQRLNRNLVVPGMHFRSSLFDARTVYWITTAVLDDGTETPVYTEFTLVVPDGYGG